MTFNPEISDHQFELQTPSIEKKENLGELQGRKISITSSISDRQEVAKLSRLSNDIWEKVAEFYDPITSKTFIFTLSTTIKTVNSTTFELIHKMKALLLGKEHLLSKEKVLELISQCGPHVTKLNLKELAFTTTELMIIVRVCTKLNEIEIDNFNEENWFELLQVCGQYLKTLDLSKLDLTQENLQLVFHMCPCLSSIKTKNLQILQNLVKDPQSLVDREWGISINDIYQSAVREYLKYETQGPPNSPNFMLVKNELMKNLELSYKIREINSPLFLLSLNVHDHLTILSNCPHLIKLNLSSCRNYTVDDWKIILSHCQKLISLNLSFCQNLNGSIEFIPSTLKELNLLDVDLTDNLISQLPDGLTHLALKIEEGVSSEVFTRFAALEFLEILDLREPQQSLIKFLSPGLKELNIMKCDFHQLDISQLPKSLQKLTVRAVSCHDKNKPFFTKSDHAVFPSSLTSVKICSDKSSSPRPLLSGDLQALPQSIKSLTFVENCGYSTLDSLLPLPCDLEELNLQFVNLHLFWKDGVNKPLPSRLKMISCIPDGTFERFDFLKDDLSTAFPSRSKRLKIKIDIANRYTIIHMKHLAAVANVAAVALVQWCERNNVQLESETPMRKR